MPAHPVRPITAARDMVMATWRTQACTAVCQTTPPTTEGLARRTISHAIQLKKFERETNPIGQINPCKIKVNAIPAPREVFSPAMVPNWTTIRLHKARWTGGSRPANKQNHTVTTGGTIRINRLGRDRRGGKLGQRP